MKYDNVIFFNFFHLGDIHISRNYMKEMMSRIDADTFFEANQYGDHVIKDIDNLHYLRWHSFVNFCGVPYDVPYAVNMNGDKKTLFINTWVGQNQPLNKMPSKVLDRSMRMQSLPNLHYQTTSISVHTKLKKTRQ